MKDRRLITSGLLRLCLTCGSVVSAETPIAHGTPRIDGEREALWDQSPTLPVILFVEADSVIDAAAAARGSAGLLWDEDHLYVLIEVRDLELSRENANRWEQDSVELFLDERGDRSATYGDDDAHYRVNFAGSASGGSHYDPSNVTAATAKIEGGYRVELAIRWRKVSPHPNQTIAVEIQINDATGNERVAICKWQHATNESWFNTQRFGLLTLKEQVDPKILLRPTPEIGTPRPSLRKLTHKAPRYPVPEWVPDAIFYQIFPERFRNGDPSNDPTKTSLEFPDRVPDNWHVSDWGSDWYARDAWEVQMGADFYEDGVFHRRYGGDLQGVLDRLDYLVELGINTIYFNPIFYARSLHKYDGNSFHHIDPYFGPSPAADLALIRQESADPASWKWTESDKLFLKLLQEAKRRNLRVIIDGVFNHCGRDFFAFSDLREKQRDSVYRDWYVVKSYDDPGTPQNEFRYDCWWGIDTLPNFADLPDGTDLRPGPKSYILDATRRWMDPNGDGHPSDGIDGWRLDVANEVPQQFWLDWHAEVKRINPDAYTVAEVWGNSADYLHQTGFTAVMNYYGFAFPTKGYLIDGRLPPSRFAEVLRRRREAHPWPTRYALQNLIESHDTPRLASMIVNAAEQPYLQADRYDYDLSAIGSARENPDYDVSRPDARDRRIQRMVALFQATYVGPPMLYYGTEIGLWGGDDPDDRKPMVWDDLEYQDESQHPRGVERSRDPVRVDISLLSFYQDAWRYRTHHHALRRGRFQCVLVDDEQKLFAFLRESDEGKVFVTFNRGETAVDATIDARWFRVLGDNSLSTVDEPWNFRRREDGRWQIQLPPLSAMAVEVQ